MIHIVRVVDRCIVSEEAFQVKGRIGHPAREEGESGRVGANQLAAMPVPKSRAWGLPRSPPGVPFDEMDPLKIQA